MKKSQTNRLLALTRSGELNNDNLHRIAISNLKDEERRIMRWWSWKYRTPLKPLGEHTIEELIVEMLEDWYSKHPQEAERFLDLVDAEEWNGETTPEYEAEIQRKLKKINAKNKVDISKFQTTEEMSDDQYHEMLKNLGRDLPGSKKQREAVLGVSEAEFEDAF